MDANRWISRWVSSEESIVSPAWISRTAVGSRRGGEVLSRKPHAPRRSGSKTYSSRSKGCQHDALHRPVRRGEQSAGGGDPVHPRHPHIHDQDIWAQAASRGEASSPVPASATTVMSDWPSSMTRRPSRTGAWSSASTTRITRRSRTGSGGPDRRLAAGRGCRGALRRGRASTSHGAPSATFRRTDAPAPASRTVRDPVPAWSWAAIAPSWSTVTANTRPSDRTFTETAEWGPRLSAWSGSAGRPDKPSPVARGRCHRRPSASGARRGGQPPGPVRRGRAGLPAVAGIEPRTFAAQQVEHPGQLRGRLFTRALNRIEQ